MNSQRLVNSRTGGKVNCRNSRIEAQVVFLAIVFTAGSARPAFEGKHCEQRRRGPPLTLQHAHNDRD
jgi:hypothetical protein